MKTKDYVTLGFTFITGLFFGFYVYVAYFAPQYVQDDVPEKSDISISAEMYGGCMMITDNCGAFHLTDTGAYQYTASKNDVKERGTLPDDVLEDVLQLLRRDTLVQYAQPVAIRNCASYADGVDYRYIISIRGASYTLDTCATQFPRESTLQGAFLEVWRYAEDPTVTYPIIIEEGLGGFLIDRLQNAGN